MYMYANCVRYRRKIKKVNSLDENIYKYKSRDQEK